MNKILLSKQQEHVLSIIKANPGVQNDDMKLLEAVWLQEGWDEGKSLFWNLSRVTHPETISRCRRLLHERGHITYNKIIEQERYNQFIEITNEYGERVMRLF